MCELRDVERLRNVPERILGDNSFFRLAENEPDAPLVVGMTEHVVGSGKIEVHLAGVFWLERPHFKVNDDKAAKLEVIEEQIELEILSSNLKRNLAPDERKSYAEFDQKLPQVCQELPFEVALLCLPGERQETEIVGVF